MGPPCATTSAAKSIRRRCTCCGVRRPCSCQCIRRVNGPGCPRCRVHADAPRVLWALDFQFDSTIDRKAVKIASMIDEHTRESLLHLVERSVTAQRLVMELEEVFDRAGGPPMVLRMDNGPELISQALQRFCDGKVGLSYIPPGAPRDNG